MEDYYNVKRLALVLAVQAEIEGMKATNDYRKNHLLDPFFNQTHFENKAAELKNLAYAHGDQL